MIEQECQEVDSRPSSTMDQSVSSEDFRAYERGSEGILVSPHVTIKDLEKAMRLENLVRYARRIDMKDKCSSSEKRQELAARRRNSVCCTGVSIKKDLGLSTKLKPPEWSAVGLLRKSVESMGPILSSEGDPVVIPTTRTKKVKAKKPPSGSGSPGERARAGSLPANLLCRAPSDVDASLVGSEDSSATMSGVGSEDSSHQSTIENPTVTVSVSVSGQSPISHSAQSAPVDHRLNKSCMSDDATSCNTSYSSMHSAPIAHIPAHAGWTLEGRRRSKSISISSSSTARKMSLSKLSQSSSRSGGGGEGGGSEGGGQVAQLTNSIRDKRLEDRQAMFEASMRKHADYLRQLLFREGEEVPEVHISLGSLMSAPDSTPLDDSSEDQASP